MNEALTTLQLSERVLEAAGRPLTPVEIWEDAQRMGLNSGLWGKTPWISIRTRIYNDIRDNFNTIFSMPEKRPVKFSLKHFSTFTEPIVRSEKKEDPRFGERDLHPVVVWFIDNHFHARVRTIYHEKSVSLKRKKGLNGWLHPDLVGVYYPFPDFDHVTLGIQKHMSASSVKFYSFELKKTLKLIDLREYYFQAVSNSSWAHEGYLVVGDIDKDEDLQSELRRLNSAFGIGVIQLNLENIYDSEIIIPARVNAELDWNTINRLVEENTDFKELMNDVQVDMTNGKVEGKYDPVFEDEKMMQYLKEKKITKRPPNE